MSARFAYVLAGLLTATAAPAFAQPEVRDHRAPPPPPSSQGGVSVDNTGPRPVDNGPRRYRRRPGPRFMMPLKVDIGGHFRGTDRGLANGLAAAVGIHWASLSPNPTNTDVGIGVFGAIANAPEDTSIMDDKNTLGEIGLYAEVGHTLSQGSFWRTWAAGRGEYFASSAFGNDKIGFGAAGRLSAELFVSGAGIEPRGLFLGTYALGVYAEVGARDTVVDVSKLHASLGLTFRTPLVFAP